MKTYLSKNIKYLREKNKFSQEELSRKLGKQQRIISFYEAGKRKPTIEGLISISELFGVAVDDLLKKDLSIEHK